MHLFSNQKYIKTITLGKLRWSFSPYKEKVPLFEIVVVGEGLKFPLASSIIRRLLLRQKGGFLFVLACAA